MQDNEDLPSDTGGPVVLPPPILDQEDLDVPTVAEWGYQRITLGYTGDVRFLEVADTTA